jgi:putative flippase GtrA
VLTLWRFVRSNLHRIRKFLSVGGVSTLVNLIVTTVLSQFLWFPMAAFLAFVTSGQVSYVLHSIYTFEDRPQHEADRTWRLRTFWKPSKRWLVFVAVNWFFGFANFVIVFAMTHMLPMLPWLHNDSTVVKAIAYIVAGATVSPFNFKACNRLVFPLTVHRTTGNENSA